VQRRKEAVTKAIQKVSPDPIYPIAVLLSFCLSAKFAITINSSYILF